MIHTLTPHTSMQMGLLGLVKTDSLRWGFVYAFPATGDR